MRSLGVERSKLRHVDDSDVSSNSGKHRSRWGDEAVLLDASKYSIACDQFGKNNEEVPIEFLSSTSFTNGADTMKIFV